MNELDKYSIEMFLGALEHTTQSFHKYKKELEQRKWERKRKIKKERKKNLQKKK